MIIRPIFDFPTSFPCWCTLFDFPDSFLGASLSSTFGLLSLLLLILFDTGFLVQGAR